MNELATELLNSLDTYVELSQSKTGLHFIFADNASPADFSGKKGAGIEIYYSKRYAALTGWVVSETNEIKTYDGKIAELVKKYFPKKTVSVQFLGEYEDTPVKSDEDVLNLLQSNNKFQRLFYDGDISGYLSQSEADGALLAILAKATALNATQMRRLFSQSALGQRKKWQNRIDYQDCAISGALGFAVEKLGAQKEIGGNNMDDNRLNDYDQTEFEMHQNARFSCLRQTGFPTIDKQQGFPPGVYCLAAITGAGKTAFSTQLGYQLAQRDESVIMAGYETTPLEVYSRILARLMKQLNPHSRYSAYDVQMKACADDPYYQAARQQIRRERLNFRIWKMTPEDTVPKLLQRIQQFIGRHPDEKPPVVILDYIQIIPHTGDIKSMLDTDIPKIKMFQQETNTTFILISSTNRASYRLDAGMEAFKESGIIEFSADVIWMLQYSKLSDGTALTPKKLAEEKARVPRKMTLKCLKNRFGTGYEVHLDYYSKFELFEEATLIIPAKQLEVQPPKGYKPYCQRKKERL